MRELRYTLLSDGSTDQRLLYILAWLLQENHVYQALRPQWADLRRLPSPPRELSERAAKAVELYPCDLLFVHRDAEREPRETRAEEIIAALGPRREGQPPFVCVVPVRMQEAWLLFDESALRRAAGNPSGRAALNLPRPERLESVSDPKRLLEELLRDASGLHGRRRRRLDTSSGANRLASLIRDFSPLRNLSAFQALEADVHRAVHTNRWCTERECPLVVRENARLPGSGE